MSSLSFFAFFRRRAIECAIAVLMAFPVAAPLAHAEPTEAPEEAETPDADGPSSPTSAPTDASDADGAGDPGLDDESVEKREPRERVYSYGIDEIVVTASPLPKKASELPGAVSILQGTELLQKQQPTIGETVRYLPGVSASYFGPGASRPILRGLGGSRVQMLVDQLDVFDASAASNDHAVAADTLGVEKIEILRGPATLRFGPNAVGGVVSTIENRVPRKLVDAPVTGTVELRGSSVDGGVGGAAVLNGSVDKFAWRLKGYGFTAGDTAIPGFAESEQLRAAEAAEGDEDEDPEEEAFGFIPNSQVEYTGFSAGGSWIEDDFYLGLAVSDFQTNYGVVFHELEGHSHAAPGEEEPPISVDLDTTSLDFAGGLVEPVEGIRSVDARLRLTDYQHHELAGDLLTTTFKNKGYDLRIEAVHEPFGLFEGAFGFQSAFSDFQVTGDEGFLPNTYSARQSLFVIEEVDLDPVTLEVGGRFDYATVKSGGGGLFGDPVDRDFPGGAASVGVVYDVVEDQILSFDVSWSMRPPNYEELFADGIHVASGFYEIGDPDLDSENALGLNLGYAGQFSIFDWSASAFYDRFWGFTFLQGTGETVGVVPVGRFFSTDATFTGGEVQIGAPVFEEGAQRLYVVGRFDYVRAQNLDADEPLPRIPPLRFGGSLIYDYDAFQAELDILQAQAQNRVPEGEFTTDGYTMLDLSFSYAFGLDTFVQPLLFFRISNLLNEEARASESFLKDRAPLPGRNFTGGVQVRF